MKVFVTNSVWEQPGSAARLEALWRSGRLTMTQIADMLTREYGVEVSRNAIVGKLGRLGLFGQGGTEREAAPRAEAERSLTITLPMSEPPTPTAPVA